MQEIIVKENKLGIKVFIHEVPSLNLIPKEKADSIIKALEFDISLKLDSGNNTK